MYGIYGEIIDAAKKALDSLEETKELLEYPEVQADKAYYLSVLSKYNELQSLNDKLSALLSALEEEKAYSDMLAEIDGDDERAVVYQEISSLKRNSAMLADSLSDALGCRHINERAYCRFRLGEYSCKFGVALFSLIKTDLLSRGAKIYDENTVIAKGGFVQEISFEAEGAGVIARLIPLIGAHKVYTASSKSDELRFAITPSANVEKISEDDLKIDIFHSHGAGGQHINKVETAVRVTHLPTGITVVCQDERSQLKNKKRALQTIEKRLIDLSEQSEKRRIEADIKEQYSKKNTPISFDAVSNTFTDTRLKAFSKVAFPLASEQFNLYMNGLLAL